MGIVNDATMHLACTIDRGTRLRGMDAGHSPTIYCMMGQLSAPPPVPSGSIPLKLRIKLRF